MRTTSTTTQDHTTAAHTTAAQATSTGPRRGRRRSVRRWAAVAAASLVVALGVAACAPPPPPAAGPAPGIQTDVLNAMNNDRAANGLGALAWNQTLANNAANWASHLSTAGSGLVHQDLGNLLNNDPAFASFSTLGENLLVGPSTMSAGDMETSWMNSSSHRANILRGAFTIAGVGTATSGDKIWVAVEFGA